MGINSVTSSVGIKDFAPRSSPAPQSQAKAKSTSVQPVDAVAATPAPDERGGDSAKQLEQALNERISQFLSTNTRLQIDRDHDTGRFVYKAIDSQTGELKTQFPAEEVLRMLAFFKELDGLLYDEQA